MQRCAVPMNQLVNGDFLLRAATNTSRVLRHCSGSVSMLDSSQQGIYQRCTKRTCSPPKKKNCQKDRRCFLEYSLKRVDSLYACLPFCVIRLSESRSSEGKQMHLDNYFKHCLWPVNKIKALKKWRNSQGANMSVFCVRASGQFACVER